MILRDMDLFRDGRFYIEPFNREQVQPCSYDLRLGKEFIQYEYTSGHTGGYIDTREGMTNIREVRENTDTIVLQPQEFVLATTQERIHMPADMCGVVSGRSSVGRIGIEVHQTAGFIDSGFDGEITLELVNNSQFPIRLHSGDRICQIIFHQLTGESEYPYGSIGSESYQNQQGVQGSGMNFE